MTTPAIAGVQAPGVYLRDVYPPPPPSLLTGVPAFLGLASDGEANTPQPLTLWPQFEASFGPARADGYLAYAVRGFFENGGLLCYVVRLDEKITALVSRLQAGLASLQATDPVDLVCAPDIMASVSLTQTADLSAVTDSQVEVLADCARSGRFAILDAVLTSETKTVQGQRTALTSPDGAIYHPWLWVPSDAGTPLYLPPCGHVAGIYARTDQQTGVHKAPANEVIEQVLDLRVSLTDDVIGELYAGGVNCLRAVPGRGIRVWGACTLSDDPGWRNIGARRVFLTLGRWLELFMAELAYEPNDVRLWVRIMRELTAYLDGLHQRGALKGRSPEEAFFVKCDSETNPPEVADAGMVVTEVGLALAAPAELVVVRIIHGASGVSIQPGSAT